MRYGVVAGILSMFLIGSVFSVQSLHAASTYKLWALAFNVDPQAGNISACTFAATVTAVKCEYFDLSKLYLDKGSNPNFVVGFVPILLEAPPPSDMQMCLEAQKEAGTNAKPGDWLFQCKPVTKDAKGFYIAKFDLMGMSQNNTSQSVIKKDNGDTGNMTGGCMGEQCIEYCKHTECKFESTTKSPVARDIQSKY